MKQVLAEYCSPHGVPKNLTGYKSPSLVSKVSSMSSAQFHVNKPLSFQGQHPASLFFPNRCDACNGLSISVSGSWYRLGWTLMWPVNVQWEQLASMHFDICWVLMGLSWVQWLGFLITVMMLSIGQFSPMLNSHIMLTFFTFQVHGSKFKVQKHYHHGTPDIIHSLVHGTWAQNKKYK